MRIELDQNTLLTSDDSQFILKDVKKVKQADGTIKTSERVIGYYGELKHALNAYIKRSQANSQAETLQELLVETRMIYKYVKDLTEGVTS